MAVNSTTKNEVNDQKDTVERNNFMEKLKRFHENKGVCVCSVCVCVCV